MVSKIRLSKRLTAIADMVNSSGSAPGGYCLCDVGTDHAHSPIRLLMEGRIGNAIAMDVIEGPLEKARENIERYGVTGSVTLRLSDGLDAYEAGEASGLVIAGMGGRIIRKILMREPHKSLDFDELILQPQADPEFVRGAVRELGLFIDREQIVLEDNKYYPVMHITHDPVQGPDWGAPAASRSLYQETEDHFGPVLLRARAPMLRSYLLWQKGVNDRILHSLSNASGDSLSLSEKKEQILRKDLLIRTALGRYL